MKIFTSENQKKGEIGETVVCNYLLKGGFEILQRNYTKKWGEIDIMAWKGGAVHFIEVKSVTRENFTMTPEDQMSAWKQHKLARMIELYVNENAIGDWQVDLACVHLDMERRVARIKFWQDIILG
jgi:putative endonuclease